MPFKKLLLLLSLIIGLMAGTVMVINAKTKPAVTCTKPQSCSRKVPMKGAGSSWYFITHGIFHFSA
jgi:hypothetical protein